MKIRNVISLIILFAIAILPACGGGDDSNGGDSGGVLAQPVRAIVFIAFDQPVENLAGLDLTLNNSAGASFDNNSPQIAPINAAEGSSVVANFDASRNSTRIAFINGGAAGINTGTTPIIRITFAVADGSGRPTFSVDATPANFSAISDPNSTPTTPPVTASNVVVTVTYE
jgi:hypothetical protein